jgi:hypothetical protein
MPTSEGTPARTNGLSIDKLSETATTLNSASRKLNESVEKLNAALKQLNLGVPAWFQTWVHEDNSVSDVEEIGYARVKGRWGIVIRKTIDFHNGPDPDENEWHFADAPRDLRIRNIEFLPQLIDKLNADTADVAAKLSERANDAEALAAVISSIAEEKAPIKRVKLLPESERGK